MGNLSPGLDELKKTAYDTLADCYLNYLDSHNLGKFERKVLSQKILDGVSHAKTASDLIDFLTAIARNYPFMTLAAARIREVAGQDREQDVINKLRQHIGSL